MDIRRATAQTGNPITAGQLQHRHPTSDRPHAQHMPAQRKTAVAHMNPITTDQPPVVTSTPRNVGTNIATLSQSGTSDIFGDLSKTRRPEGAPSAKSATGGHARSEPSTSSPRQTQYGNTNNQRQNPPPPPPPPPPTQPQESGTEGVFFGVNRTHEETDSEDNDDDLSLIHI